MIKRNIIIAAKTTIRLLNSVIGALIWKSALIIRGKWIGKLKKIFFTRRSKHYLCRMPLYMLVGNHEPLAINPMQSLKSFHTKLQSQFKHAHWIFSDTAIFITKTTDALLKYILKNRKDTPINGIIVLTSIENINVNHEIAKQILHLNQPFKHDIPVYLILTEVQTITGFDDFFKDVSHEETLQPWGIDLNDSNFESQYNSMLDKLQKRTMWLMNNLTDTDARRMIFNFPQQLNLLKKDISKCIFTNTRCVYFCANNNYFNKQLLNSVILAERKLVGFSHRYQFINKYKPIIISILSPCLLATCYLVMSTSFTENKIVLREINTNIAQYKMINHSIMPDNTSILNPIKALNILDRNVALSSKSNFYSHFILSKKLLSKANRDAFLRAMNILFTTRIAALLEQQLKETPRNNINALYTLLKGYLAFSPSYYTNAQSVIAPMLYYWQHQYRHNKSNLKKIKYYLLLAVKQPLTKLPLDHLLINSIKQILHKINPSQRAYALLSYRAKTQYIDIPKIITPLNSHFDLNPLYTIDGYQQIFNRYIDLIASQVANDNNEINPIQHHKYNKQSIKNQLHQLYNKRYIDSWKTMLMNIHLKSCHSLTECITLGESLSNNNGPLNQLIKIIIDNSQSINDSALSINKHFKPYAVYSKQPLTKLQNDIHSVTNILINAKQSSNPQQYLLAQAKSLYKPKQNALSILKQDSDTAPKPIQHIINQLISNYRQLITKEASNYINTQWQQTVLLFYRQYLAHKFPISNNTNDQISIDHFTKFFNSNGIWMNFYKQYLQAFKPYNSITTKLITINKQYFRQQVINIEIAFNPALLSNNSKSILINIGQQRIIYQHGPRNINLIKWPAKLADNGCSIVFNDFESNKHVLSFSGPWALFQCLSAGNIYYKGDNHYSYHLAIEHHTATFSLTTNISHQAFSLKTLKSLHLPTTLISIK